MILEHTLPDGRTVHVVPLFGGRARLCVVDGPYTYGTLY